MNISSTYSCSEKSTVKSIQRITHLSEILFTSSHAKVVSSFKLQWLTILTKYKKNKLQENDYILVGSDAVKLGKYIYDNKYSGFFWKVGIYSPDCKDSCPETKHCQPP
jgi:hypothetical protein